MSLAYKEQVHNLQVRVLEARLHTHLPGIYVFAGTARVLFSFRHIRNVTLRLLSQCQIK